MAYIEEANELMTDATGQSIATAIGNMSSTSVGNLAALQTTDKTSLVGAVNEVKSGLNDLGEVVLLVHEEMPTAGQWIPYQDITIDVNAYRYFGLRLSMANSAVTGTPLCIFSRAEFLASNAATNPLAALFNAADTGDSYNVLVVYNDESATPLFYYRGTNVLDSLYLTIVGIK